MDPGVTAEGETGSDQICVLAGRKAGTPAPEQRDALRGVPKTFVARTALDLPVLEASVAHDGHDLTSHSGAWTSPATTGDIVRSAPTQSKR